MELKLQTQNRFLFLFSSFNRTAYGIEIVIGFTEY